MFPESFTVRPLCPDQTNIALIRPKQIMEFWLQLHVCNSILELRPKYNYIWLLSSKTALCTESKISEPAVGSTMESVDHQQQSQQTVQKIVTLDID